jgi:hypothetical protein
MRVPIQWCEVGVCAYNQHDSCHAVAVEIGKDSANCDLFTRSVMFVVNPKFNSQVSACRMSGCAYNRLGSCTREKITVSAAPGGGVCAAYESRLQALANE